MRKTIIMGAGGRDFHNFNVAFRDDPETEVVAFTATQIPGIDSRVYPASLAGPRYPDGIPLRPEDELTGLIRERHVDEVGDRETRRDPADGRAVHHRRHLRCARLVHQQRDGAHERQRFDQQSGRLHRRSAADDGNLRYAVHGLVHERRGPDDQRVPDHGEAR